MPSGEPSPVFVGRDAELALLERALDVAAGGAAGTVLVGGESGAGKSRLIREFAAKAGDRALVLVGGCVAVSAVALRHAPVLLIITFRSEDIERAPRRMRRSPDVTAGSSVIRCGYRCSAKRG
jgi:alpha-D-ribose 1-methylphosphonate 5-triphosphate synthase subunit PhnL